MSSIALINVHFGSIFICVITFTINLKINFSRYERVLGIFMDVFSGLSKIYHRIAYLKNLSERHSPPGYTLHAVLTARLLWFLVGYKFRV